jgi:DNA-binding XRE family transcriptional regulator
MPNRKRSTELHKKLVEKVLSDPEGRAVYEAFGFQFELAAKMKKAREKAHLTQEDVAQRMGTKKPAISRLEGNTLTKKPHSPSVVTLMKYAHAIGKELKIDFVKQSAF